MISFFALRRVWIRTRSVHASEVTIYIFVHAIRYGINVYGIPSMIALVLLKNGYTLFQVNNLFSPAIAIIIMVISMYLFFWLRWIIEVQIPSWQSTPVPTPQYPLYAATPKQKFINWSALNVDRGSLAIIAIAGLFFIVIFTWSRSGALSDLCLFSCSPTESSARTVFEARLRGQLGSVPFMIRSFDKINSQEMNVFGIQGYSLEYRAEVEFPEGYRPECVRDRSGGYGGREFDFNCFQFSNSTSLSAQARGARVPFSGTINFQKTEKGWAGSIALDNWRHRFTMFFTWIWYQHE